MGQISLATGEQREGVAQVSDAVSQMNLVTQKNAGRVEEGAAAAESLQLQAQSLVQAMANFHVPDAMPDSALVEPSCGP